MLHSFIRRSSAARIALITLISAGFNICSSAQSYIYATGAPSFNTAQPVEAGFVDVANGNLHIEIPLASPSQRGSLGVGERLVYDSRIWQPVNGVWNPSNVPNSMLGWRFLSGAETGAAAHITSTHRCDDLVHTYTMYSVFNWTAPNGTVRNFPITTERDDTGCDSGNTSSADAAATDSSGYHMYVTGFTAATVFAPDGTKVYPTWKDTNGNSFSTDGSGNLVDTLGRTPVAYSTGSNQNYYDVLGSDGQSHRVIVTYAAQTATSAFSQYTNQSVSQNAITRVDLPDGSHYSFGYDSWGELNNITLPTTGQITYTYTTFTDAYGNQNRWVYTRANGAGTWTFTPSVAANSICQAIQTSGTIDGCQQVTLLNPSGDTVTYTFSMNGGAWNSKADFYNNGGTRLATATMFFDLANTCTGCIGAAYVRALTATTQLPTVNSQTLTKQIQYTYDSVFNGNVTAIKEWNFTTGTFGPNPDRETDIGYISASDTTINGPAYIAANIVNLPKFRKTSAGPCCTNLLSETDYSYDTIGPTSKTGITHHDDVNYGVANTVRGNPTKTQQWIVGSTYWATTSTYDMTGQLVQIQDNKSNNTSYDYADHFYNDTGTNPPTSVNPPNGPTNALPTTITRPSNLSETLNYYFGSGKVAFTTDQNNATSYLHYADPLDRLTQVKDPIGGWRLLAYPSSTQTDTYTGLTDATPSTACSSCRHDQLLLDTLGRASNVALVNDPDGRINADSSYDSNGRLSSTSNPYRSTIESTYGSTSTTYDGLDRVLQITRQDNINTVVNTYGAALPSATSICGVSGIAFPSVTTDEALKKRQYWNDGFGRLVEVDEPDAGGSFSIATCYIYDMLDRLTSSTQRGGDSNSANWRMRSYAYDGLSRVTQVTTPEAGTVNYSFTSSGNPCSGDPSLPCTRTDARNVVTTYTYDTLNRLTGKTYTGTTPAVAYFYDQPTYNGLTIANGKGRRTGMNDGTGQTAWTYDAAGNVRTKQQTIAGVTKSISYTYNLNSSVATMTSPNGRVYTYAYSNAFRPVSLADNGSGITYVQGAQYVAAGL